MKIVITCYTMMMMMTLDAGVCVCVGKNHLVPVGGALSDQTILHFSFDVLPCHIDAVQCNAMITYCMEPQQQNQGDAPFAVVLVLFFSISKSNSFSSFRVVWSPLFRDDAQVPHTTTSLSLFFHAKMMM